MFDLTDDFWRFVYDNANADVSSLRLKWHGKPSPGFDLDFAIRQIECRKRFGKKLGETLEANPRFLFPDTLAGEQATSDLLACYHSTLVPERGRVCDLTAGLGIDVMYMAAKSTEVTAIEIDTLKVQTLTYNTRNIGNVQVCCCDCRDFIQDAADRSFDTLFIDPHRRGDRGERVFALEQCAPDVTAMLARLRRLASTLIVKASPMLDITRIAAVLPGIRRVITVGTATECKEIVAVVDLNHPNDFEDYRELSDTFGNNPYYSISAVTLSQSGLTDEFTFTPEQERAATCEYGIPKEGDIVYEPSPSLMKAGPYNLISRHYGLKKISPNTHVYFSDTPVDGFDGIAYRLERIIPYESKFLKRLHKEYPRLNVAVRNFGMSADELRRKLRVADGGTHRLLAVTNADGAKSMLLLSQPL